MHDTYMAERVKMVFDVNCRINMRMGCDSGMVYRRRRNDVLAIPDGGMYVV